MNMDASEVRQAIAGVDHLSTIPVILKKIVEITDNLSSSPEDLYRVISHDQSLAEKVIRMANSPLFGQSRRVSSLKQAIMLLGYEKIRNISVSMSVVSILSKKGDVNLRQFWAHSYAVAYISAMLAETATMLSPSVTFISGLLHDTGRLLFYNLDHQRYENIEGTKDLLARETSLFGCDHAAAGSWIAENARMLPEQILAIRYHHAPSQTPEFKDMAAAVSLAEALSARLNPQREDDGIWTEEHDRALLELSISQEEIGEIYFRLSAEKNDVKRFLKLV